MQRERIGIDLGGTKTEIIVLAENGVKWRKRSPTPASSSQAITDNIASLVREAWRVAPAAPVGIAMPGAITAQGLVKNSNTVCLNGKPFQREVEQALACPVRMMNDANCFTLSEAVDGAAMDVATVWGVIIGTGVGGGLVIDKKLLQGANAIAGEWGHNALCLRAPRAGDSPRRCYCGKTDCVETYLCGKGLSQTCQEMYGWSADGWQLAAAIEQGDARARQLLSFYAEQMAASLAVMINIVDPDKIVLGGGLSNLPQLADAVQSRLPGYVFSPTIATRVVSNKHGDASGVRGAAWLWPGTDGII